MAASLSTTPRTPSWRAFDRLGAVDGRRQQDRPHFEPPLQQFLERIDPAGLRHGKVEEQDVRPQLGDALHRLAPVGGFSDDGEPWFGLEQSAEAVAENRVVVGNDDADGVLGATHGASGGC